MQSQTQARAQLALLLLCAVVLLLLSCLPTSRAAMVSSETRFAETSAHGLNIVPASCASYGANYYDAALPTSPDGHGFTLPPSGVDLGAYAPYAGMYVCVHNNTGNTYFVPANNASELQTFKGLSGQIGVASW